MKEALNSVYPLKKKKNPLESGQWLFPSHYGSHGSIGLHSEQLLHSPLPCCIRSCDSEANNASSDKEYPLVSCVRLSLLLQLLLLPLVSMRSSLLSVGPFPSLKSSLRSILAVMVRCIYPQQGTAVKSSVDLYSCQVKRADFSQRLTLNLILL